MGGVNIDMCVYEVDTFTYKSVTVQCVHVHINLSPWAVCMQSQKANSHFMHGQYTDNDHSYCCLSFINSVCTCLSNPPLQNMAPTLPHPLLQLLQLPYHPWHCSQPSSFTFHCWPIGSEQHDWSGYQGYSLWPLLQPLLLLLLLLLHKLREAATAAAGSVVTVLTYNPPLPVFRVVREGRTCFGKELYH